MGIALHTSVVFSAKTKVNDNILIKNNPHIPTALTTKMLQINRPSDHELPLPDIILVEHNVFLNSIADSELLIYDERSPRRQVIAHYNATNNVMWYSSAINNDTMNQCITTIQCNSISYRSRPTVYFIHNSYTLLLTATSICNLQGESGKFETWGFMATFFFLLVHSFNSLDLISRITAAEWKLASCLHWSRATLSVIP